MAIEKNYTPSSDQQQIEKKQFENTKEYEDLPTKGLRTGGLIYAQTYIDLINKIQAEYNWRRNNKPSQGETVFMENFSLTDESQLSPGKVITATEIKLMVEEINKLGHKGTLCDCNCNYCACNCNYQ